LLHAVMNAVWGYLSIRLCIGIFGHDTYEIYWWVVLGLTIAVHNMTQVAAKITQRQLDSPELEPIVITRKNRLGSRLPKPALPRLPG
jgi:hypothetical protein